jgi:hypothetical protein
VARFGSAELLIGNGTMNDGLVVITYQLPAERHDRSATTPAPAGSAAATANERDRAKAYDRR